MQWIVEWIRRIVILVLLMEVVLQLQSGRQYEAYIRMLIGLMILYNLVSGILGAFGQLENVGLEKMEVFQWSESLFSGLEQKADEAMEQSGKNVESLDTEVQVNILPIAEIAVREVQIGIVGE